jgi:type IV fimbrial biogenesis protein FimT
MHQTRAKTAITARGFGMLGLLVALILATILIAVAVPAYGDWIATTEIMNEAQHLAGSMNRARAAAINGGFRVNLCQTDGSRKCLPEGSWERGWMLFMDRNGDGERDDDEPVLWVEEAAAPGVTMVANGPIKHYVSYTSYGHARTLSGALQMGTFTVCRQGKKGVDVVLAHSGRVRIAKTSTICP